MALLHARVLTELDRCPVGREHPTHRRLVAGELTRAELARWSIQPWQWHRAFPAVLAMLAAQSPVPGLRASLLMRAALEDGALPAQSAGRCEEWKLVCRALGVGPEQLAVGRPTAETETMIAIQTWAAARPFAEGWVGIMAGVDGETQMHTLARRHAMYVHYGVPEEALGYFQIPARDPVANAIAPLEPYLGELSLDRACEALRLVLHARWGYFSGIGADGASPQPPAP
jgi:pyrroloquinoline quinone (PQQ) biosynthesis protein C